ncbi:hypothetical protein DPMN_086337 [Dreissena polymorpha]|uniref:Uncharacterized protein n=1 Tax=Dreissena polymorpha TaxID=45954 RepID=A0A9D4KQ72_DREPO|nr:hypothetical protein DPMN_086309 [Dreissena polymorpha]KAH3844086.1 hypothetical protein DPMN_086337 [Dreissena polymorpha]
MIPMAFPKCFVPTRLAVVTLIDATSIPIAKPITQDDKINRLMPGTNTAHTIPIPSRTQAMIGTPRVVIPGIFIMKPGLNRPRPPHRLSAIRPKEASLLVEPLS